MGLGLLLVGFVVLEGPGVRPPPDHRRALTRRRPQTMGYFHDGTEIYAELRRALARERRVPQVTS